MKEYGSYALAAQNSLKGAAYDIFRKDVRIPLFDNAMINYVNQINEGEEKDALLLCARTGDTSVKAWENLVRVSRFEGIEERINDRMGEHEHRCIDREIRDFSFRRPDLDYFFISKEMDYPSKVKLENTLQDRVAPFKTLFNGWLGTFYIDFRFRSIIPQLEASQMYLSKRREAKEEVRMFKEVGCSADFNSILNKKLMEWNSDKRSYIFFSEDLNSEKSAVVLYKGKVGPKLTEILSYKKKSGFNQTKERWESKVWMPAIDFYEKSVSPYDYSLEMRKIGIEVKKGFYGSIREVSEKVQERLGIRSTAG
jgi:hypothetical protein